MTLYHAHSAVLRGFYQSDVFVAADNDESAVWKAVTAFKRYAKGQMDNYTLSDHTSEWIDQDEPGHEAQLQALCDAFEAEMRARLAPVGGNAAIMVKS
jgi:hypothetical protein